MALFKLEHLLNLNTSSQLGWISIKDKETGLAMFTEEPVKSVHSISYNYNFGARGPGPEAGLKSIRPLLVSFLAGRKNTRDASQLGVTLETEGVSLSESS